MNTSITVTEERLAVLFDEWNRRYAENPDSFSENLDGDGNAITGYGANCARYIVKLNEEI